MKQLQTTIIHKSLFFNGYYGIGEMYCRLEKVKIQILLGNVIMLILLFSKIVK